jgi:hypothetical protein
MKLAEALIERADLQRQTAQMRNRLALNAKVQEGETPAEDANVLLSQYDEAMDALEALIIRINRANATAAFENGTLTDAIARRDCLRSKINTYRELYEAAAIRQERYSRSEVKFVRCIDTAVLQDKIDAMSKAYRQLDTKIQEMNWTVELEN